MKFFWKIFFTTMFTSVICVTLSGYLLIDAGVRSQLDNEMQTTRDYGEIVFYSLAGAFRGTDTAEDAATVIAEVAQSISINGVNQRISFGIVDENAQTVFSSLPAALDKTIPADTDDAVGWTSLKTADGRMYVQALRPAMYRDTRFYIETLREVTHVFTAQQEQYETMLYILACMIVLAGTLTVLISKFLMRRITALTSVTRTIAKGNLHRRAAVRGGDEVALLSENFNQMADRLEAQIHELEDTAARRELFVGAFSHELKTPLTSIIGYADLLRRTDMDAALRHTCATYIFSEGKRLEVLSMRLLELIVLKQQTLVVKPVEMRTLLGVAAVLMLPQLSDAGIELTMDMERAMVSMEAELMKTVFINLLDNARKAIESGGKIEITGRKTQDSYIVAIRDSGRGMAQQELGKITEAFYMVDKSRSRRQGGAGLGLALCHEILELHGFMLHFESSVGNGTCATVTLKEGTRCSDGQTE